MVSVMVVLVAMVLGQALPHLATVSELVRGSAAPCESISCCASSCETSPCCLSSGESDSCCASSCETSPCLSSGESDSCCDSCCHSSCEISCCCASSCETSCVSDWGYRTGRSLGADRLVDIVLLCLLGISLLMSVFQGHARDAPDSRHRPAVPRRSWPTLVMSVFQGHPRLMLILSVRRPGSVS